VTSVIFGHVNRSCYLLTKELFDLLCLSIKSGVRRACSAVSYADVSVEGRIT